MINSNSNYPNSIDPMTFFHDIDLNTVSIMNEYENLISQNKFNEANALIECQQNIFGYFADFCNLIENRIYSLQKHLLQINKETMQPFIYDDAEPLVMTTDTIWI